MAAAVERAKEAVERAKEAVEKVRVAEEVMVAEEVRRVAEEVRVAVAKREEGALEGAQRCGCHTVRAFGGW